VESACNVRGDDVVEEQVEFDGDIIVPNPLLDLGLDGVVGYDWWFMNFGCE
jgi:hypothetical protein